MEFMRTHWENMMKEARFAELCLAIDCGLQALRKYYTLTDRTPVYVISLGECFLFLTLHSLIFCAVLNPNIKMEYFNQHWSTEWKKNAEAVVKTAVW